MITARCIEATKEAVPVKVDNHNKRETTESRNITLADNYTKQAFITKVMMV